MHFRDLGYFISLAQTLDPMSAALGVGIAKPTLMTAVRRLESEVGGPLFLKTPGGLRLTPMGRALLEHAPKLLWLRDQALRAVRQAGEPGRTDGIDVLPPV